VTVCLVTLQQPGVARLVGDAGCCQLQVACTLCCLLIDELPNIWSISSQWLRLSSAVRLLLCRLLQCSCISGEAGWLGVLALLFDTTALMCGRCHVCRQPIWARPHSDTGEQDCLCNAVASEAGKWLAVPVELEALCTMQCRPMHSASCQWPECGMCPAALYRSLRRQGHRSCTAIICLLTRAVDLELHSAVKGALDHACAPAHQPVQRCWCWWS
jgi:hypothetical protein